MNRKLGGARLGGMGTVVGTQGEAMISSGTETPGLLAKSLLLPQVPWLLQPQEIGRGGVEEHTELSLGTPLPHRCFSWAGLGGH